MTDFWETFQMRPVSFFTNESDERKLLVLWMDGCIVHCGK